METKFTNGPWRCSLSEPLRVLDSDSWIIATTHACDGMISEASSNATLIASAPEMYAQFEKSIQDFYAIARKLDYAGMNDDARKCEDYAENIKAVLKKARGEF